MSPEPKKPYARAEFEALCRRAAQAEKKDGLVLAGVSVVGGFAQLGFLAWADRNMPEQPKIVIAGSVFLVYMGLVLAMVVRMVRRRIRLAPRCPQCGAFMKEMSVRVALATGHCDACRGQVIV